MMSRAVMQMALDALEHSAVKHPQQIGVRDSAIDALRAALAEPEQETTKQKPEQEPDGISWLKRDSGYFTAPTPRKPLTDEQKLKLVTNWFAEDWAIKKALGLLHDYEIEAGNGITGETK